MGRALYMYTHTHTHTKLLLFLLLSFLHLNILPSFLSSFHLTSFNLFFIFISAPPLLSLVPFSPACHLLFFILPFLHLLTLNPESLHTPHPHHSPVHPLCCSFS